MQSFATIQLLILWVIILNALATNKGWAQVSEIPLRLRHTGEADLEWQNQPEIKWKIETKGGQEFSVGKDSIFLACRFDNSGSPIYRIDANNGEVQWEKKGITEINGLFATAEGDLDLVLIGTKSGLIALDQATGDEVWKTEVEADLAEPVATEDHIYAGSSDGNFYKFSLSDGSLVWASNIVEDRPEDPPGFSGEDARFSDTKARPNTPYVDGSAAYLSVFDQCRVISVDEQTGKRFWSAQTQGWVYSKPCIGDSLVFIGSQDDHIYAIDKTTGAIAWKHATKSRVEASIATVGKWVVGGSCDGIVHVLDAKTGAIIHQFQTEKRPDGGGPIYCQALISKNILILPTMNGLVYGWELESGKQLWTVRPQEVGQIESSQHAFGKLFVSTRGVQSDEKYQGGNFLYAIGPKE
jgi:eukaryotic-like serine/threonine-protein kinase